MADDIGLYLTMPKLPPRFPRGELINVNSDGQQVRRFDPEKVLKRLSDEGVVIVSIGGNGTLTLSTNDPEPVHYVVEIKSKEGA